MALIIGVVIVLLILFGFLCYKKAPPTEAIVVTGFGLARPKVVCGKGTFVLPVLQRADRLNMRLLKIDVKTPETGVKTQNGVSLWIDSVVTIQVYSENSTVLDEEVKASGLKDAKAYIMSRQQAAISNFLGMNEQGINDKVNDVLQGNLREIVSDMTVDQILTNRKQMALSVIENARPDLAKMGLEVVTFNVQDIRDAIERINIKKDNGDADALRSCLAHYLQQFLDSASIESMTLHELTIRIDGESVLNVSDKTGGVGLSGLDKDWQRTETVHKAIEQIILDADVEVFLSYDMIHYFSNKNFYGSAFWTDMLQEFGCEAVRYHGLEYYDVESNVVMLYFDGKQLCDNPDYVPEEEVKDIDAWFCYTFDMELDAGDTFTVKQVDKMQETIASVRSVFGREEGDEVADVDEDCITICTGVTLKPEQIPEFVKFLQTMNDIAEESGGTLEYTAEFTPNDMQDFATMIIDRDGDKIIPRFYRY